jgi:glutamate synthase domain-containing protein 2
MTEYLSVENITKLDVKDGDILVVKAHSHISLEELKDQIDRVKKLIEETKNISVKFIVVDEEMDISFLKDKINVDSQR